MTVTAPLERITDDRLSSRCFAVVGSGGLADELANQLEALRVGRIDLYGHSVKLELTNKASYRIGAGPDTHALSLADVARYDAIFATDEDSSAVEHLNELCLLAGVRLVIAGTRGTAIVVAVYPFSDADHPACHACCGSGTVESNDVGPGPRRAPTQRIAAGFAVALGLPVATASGIPVTRRLVGSSTQGRVHTVDVLRSRECTVCSRMVGPTRIVRTRNRWATQSGAFGVGSETLQQVVQLSDAIVTAATCTACGTLSPQQAAAYLNRLSPRSSAAALSCPVCSSGSMRLETRRDFTVAELAQRFGLGPAPVRYALVHLASATVCFDLNAGVERRPGHRPLVTGAFVAGFGSIEPGIADAGAGMMLRPEDG
jgi:hypothetical protein